VTRSAAIAGNVVGMLTPLASRANQAFHVSPTLPGVIEPMSPLKNTVALRANPIRTSSTRR
jgi:uncharacterized membrane protein YjjB (DUF3815 family)